METGFLQSLGLIVVAAAVFSLGGRLLRMPAIVVYIVAGLVLGPLTGIVEVEEALDLIAEIGIALLLFLVGLELSLAKVRDVGKVAIAAGLGQVVFTAAGGFLLCLVLGFSIVEALFLAVALTFSSTVVVVKLLDQKGDLNSLYGRIAVGIFLVQDLVVIVALTLLAGLARGEDFVAVKALTDTGLAFAGMALLLAGVLIASKYVLPTPFAWASRSPQTIFIWSLCWCFLVVFAAEYMKLSLEIGAFLAGIALAQLPYNEDLRRRVHPLMNFFIAVFFVTLGIQMEFGEAAQLWKEAIVLSLFVLIGNPLIFMVIITRMGYGEKTSFFTSVTVAQISEFSFIFAAMGLASGLIGSAVLSLTALVGVITIGVSAYMILYSEPLYNACRKMGLLAVFGAARRNDEGAHERRNGHIIVIGMNALGRELASRLTREGERVLAIDTDPEKLWNLPCETMIGSIDYAAVQHDADLAGAKLVVSTLQIEDTNILVAHRCRETGVPCAIHAFDLSILEDLLALDVRFLLTPKIDALIQQRDVLEKEGVLAK